MLGISVTEGSGVDVDGRFCMGDSSASEEDVGLVEELLGELD